MSPDLRWNVYLKKRQFRDNILQRRVVTLFPLYFYLVVDVINVSESPELTVFPLTFLATPSFGPQHLNVWLVICMNWGLNIISWHYYVHLMTCLVVQVWLFEWCQRRSEQENAARNAAKWNMSASFPTPNPWLCGLFTVSLQRGVLALPDIVLMCSCGLIHWFLSVS
jgi:hypothetical protein